MLPDIEQIAKQYSYYEISRGISKENYYEIIVSCGKFLKIYYNYCRYYKTLDTIDWVNPINNKMYKWVCFHTGTKKISIIDKRGKDGTRIRRYWNENGQIENYYYYNKGYNVDKSYYANGFIKESRTTHILEIISHTKWDEYGNEEKDFKCEIM